MKRFIIGAVLLAAFLVGCSGGNAMVGTWELQLSEAAAKEMPAGMKPAMTVEFKGDGTWEGKMTGIGKDSTGGGTYSLDGKTLKMTTTTEDGKAKESPKEETATLSEDMKSFELPGSNGMGKMVKK